MTTPPGFSRRALLARGRVCPAAPWGGGAVVVVISPAGRARGAGPDGKTISTPSPTAVRTTEAEAAKFALQPTVRTLRRFRIRSSRLREPLSLHTGRGTAPGDL